LGNNGIYTILINGIITVMMRVLDTHLVVVIPKPDADGAAGSGQDGCHGVEVDQHICDPLQDELFIHDGLKTNKQDTHNLRDD